MLDAFKAAGAIAGLMRNKEVLSAAGERIKARLAELRAVGHAGCREGGTGGDAIRVTVDGRMNVLDVSIDPSLARAALGEGRGGADDAAAVGRLIAEAVNDAIRRAQALAQEELAREARALGLPDLPGLSSLLS
jgi:DNA-binding protein YbaB